MGRERNQAAVASISPATVYEMFAAAVDAYADLPFLMVSSCTERTYLKQGARFTYATADAEVQRIAGGYRAAKYVSGQRVALALGNRPDYFWHFLALNSLGLCAVPLNPEGLEHELAFAMDHADVSLVVVASEFAEKVCAASARLAPVIPVLNIEGPDGLPAPKRWSAPDTSSSGERCALIIYTSGTTSKPKGCLISNFSCLESGRSYVEVGGLLKLEFGKERLYVPLPSFHMNVTVLALNAMLRVQGCLVTTDRFRASTWWQEVREVEATGVHYLGLIPPILLKAPKSPNEGAPSVKFGLGAGVDPTLHAAFEERFGFPLVEVWGMTETSRLIANAHEPRHIHTRAFGRPRDPWVVLVADEHGRPVPIGSAGELLVRCFGCDPRRGFFSGYVNDGAATEEAWAGGWFHTGDIVTQSQDGMLTFVDRRKNIIRRSGENIAAAEIEEAIIDHPDVSGIAVVAVPDSLRDEEPLACIVLSVDAVPDAATANAIYATAKKRLASHKLPGWIQFVSTIPTTATQKVRKDLLLDAFKPVSGASTYDMRSLKARRKV
jgi:acyl-CoA synthetase (AMP-forming)/AMP-acid ligase II